MNFSRIFLFAMLGCIILLSCSESDPLPDPGPNPNAVIVAEDAAINAAYTDADNIALFALQANGQGFRTQVEFNGDLCSKANVKYLAENNRVEVDFGDGCTSSNGVIRKGKLLIDITSSILFPGAYVTINFENYHVNGIKLEGERTLTNAGIDYNNGTITFITKVNDGKLTWPDGSQANVNVNHRRKFFLSEEEGYRAEVTGTSFGKSRTGVDFTAEIAEALGFYQTCTNTGNWTPSKGKMIIGVSQAFIFEVDYGNGNCDKVIQVKLEGETITLTLD